MDRVGKRPARVRLCSQAGRRLCRGRNGSISLFNIEKREPLPPPSTQSNDVGKYEVLKFGLLPGPGCRLGLKKGTGIHHVLLLGDTVISEGDGTFKAPVEPGPKYRLKLKHNGGVDMDYRLKANGVDIIRDHDTTTKETNFFFRVSPGCSALESAL